MDSRIVIWGLGKGYQQIRGKLFNEIKSGRYELVAYIDSTSSKHGVLDGVPVVGPESLNDYSFDYVIVAVTGVFYNDVCKMLVDRGVSQDQIIDGMSFLGEERIPRLNLINFADTYNAFIDGDDYIQYTRYPAYAKNMAVQEDYNTDFSEIAIVMQGPILEENDFTLESIRLYLARFPGIHIIVSTWKKEKNKIDDRFSSLPIEVLLLDGPSYPGHMNINYQLISSRDGTRRAKELGCKYVLKIRNDARMYSGMALSELMSLLSVFPIHKSERVALPYGRIICQGGKAQWCCFIIDFWLFGYVEDMLRLFEAKLISGSEDDIDTPPESYLGEMYIRSLGENPNYTEEYTKKKFAELFLFVSSSTLSLYWPKYNNGLQLMMEENSFAQWLSLYKRYVLEEEN